MGEFAAAVAGLLPVAAVAAGGGAARRKPPTDSSGCAGASFVCISCISGRTLMSDARCQAWLTVRASEGAHAPPCCRLLTCQNTLHEEQAWAKAHRSDGGVCSGVQAQG